MKSSVTLFSKELELKLMNLSMKSIEISDPVQDGMNTHFNKRMSDAKKIDDLTKT